MCRLSTLNKKPMEDIIYKIKKKMNKESGVMYKCIDLFHKQDSTSQFLKKRILINIY